MGTCWHTFSMTVSHCWVILVHIWTFCCKETFYNAPQISLTPGSDLSAGPAHVGGGGWTSSTASSSSTGVSPSTGRAWCQRLVGDRADLLGLHRVLTRPQLTHRLGHIEALLPVLGFVGGFLNMCTIDNSFHTKLHRHSPSWAGPGLSPHGRPVSCRGFVHTYAREPW